MSDTNSLLQLFQTPGQLAQTIGNSRVIDNSGESWEGGTWINRLQPGSWRGVGFILDAGQSHAGRRLAIHEYPYRDTAWAEDLGKLPRKFDIQAFLTGDDVYNQRDALVAACETAGPGTLIHPTMGSVECVLLDFAVTDRRERGRMVEIAMQFMLASDVRFPGVAISSSNLVASAAALVNSASAGDLSTALQGIDVIPAAAAQVSGFTNTVVGAVSDATRALNAVHGLVGIYGRFANGSMSNLLPATATVQSVLSAATTARSTVISAANNVNQLAALL